MRVSFLVDGFNVYHSLDYLRKPNGVTPKWLDLQRLCRSYLPHIDPKAIFKNLYYFSALANQRGPSVTNRHKAYIRCLEDSGIHVQLGRFKQKTIHCKSCNTKFTGFEEKETDVYIALKLLEVFALNEADCAVIFSGDTDLVPAIKTAKRLYPKAKIGVIFPVKRNNRHLKHVSDFTFQATTKKYWQHQFPDPYVLSNQKTISKPASW